MEMLEITFAKEKSIQELLFTFCLLGEELKL
jgi:hypothetical protein